MRRGMRSARNHNNTPHHWWESPVPKPIVPDDGQLEKMERERQEHLASRCRNMILKCSAYEQKQEAIMRRICDRSEIKEDLEAPRPSRSVWPGGPNGSRDKWDETDYSNLQYTTRKDNVPVMRMETNKRASVGEPARQRKGTAVKLLPLDIKATKMEPVASKSRPPFHRKPASNVAARKPAVVTHNKEEEASYKPVDNIASSWMAKLQHLGVISEDPLARPVEALDKLFQLLKLDHWYKKMEGLKLVRALAENHPDILLPRLHDVCLAVLKEVDNRRSVLAHAAIITMILLFSHLLKEMDKECEHTATILLYRVSEVSEFIRRVVDKALSAMVYSCSPVCVMNALLKGGLNHPNPLVREHMVLHLDELVQVTGTSCLLTSKNTTESFVSAINKLALDSVKFNHFKSSSQVICPEKRQKENQIISKAK